jgi:GNAT superfamily N-acetyltransferase
MNIEEISETDIDILKGVARRAIIESVEADDAIKEKLIIDTARHIDANTSNADRVFLRCVDDGVLGFILIQDYWNLSDLFVLPEAHGKGVGKMLFNAAKSVCLNNPNKGYIRVNSSFNAEGFYRALGFESFNTGKELPNFIVPLIYNL